MQRGQFYRDAGAFDDPLLSGLADGVNCLLIGQKIAFGIGIGQRRFAQHIKGVGIAFANIIPTTGQRRVDGFPHHKLLTQERHGEFDAAPDNRLTATGDEAGQRTAQGGFRPSSHQSAGDHQTPGSGINEQRFTAPQMRTPIALADFIADQAVDGGVIGDAQQGFGQAHQSDTLLAGQRKFMHQIIHSARALAIMAHSGHQPSGAFGDGRPIERRRAHFFDQCGDLARFVGAVGVGNGRATSGEGSERIGVIHQNKLWFETSLFREIIVHGKGVTSQSMRFRPVTGAD